MQHAFKSKLTITALLVIAMAITSAAQSVELTLAQAQQYAIQNAFAVKNSNYDAELAKLQSDALLGTGLPQLSATAEYQNFLNLPTSVLPGVLVGLPGQDLKVQFGVPHNFTAGLSASQLLFNGTWLVGLQASKAYAQLQQKQVAKSEQQTKLDVAQAYQSCLILDETITQLRKTREILGKLAGDTEELQKAGYAELQDVEQLQLNVTNIDTQINYLAQQSKLLRDVLKLNIGIPLTTEIVLIDNMDTLVSQVSQELLNAQFSVDNTLDIQLIQGGLGMRELNVKAKKAALLPSLAGFYNLQTQALRREFNFTDTSQPWFPIQLWGVQLNVPILSGGSKSKEIQMAQLEVRRMTDMLANARTGVELEYRRSRSDFEFSLSNVANTKASIQLAESILNKTNTKFKEGMSSSFDVAQSTNQFITAQSNYIQAIQKLLDARVRLAKSLNQL